MRKRIVLLTVAASSVAILLFVLPLAVVAQRFYTRIEYAELESRAHTVVDRISDDVRDHEVPAVRLLNAGDEDTGVALYGPDGARQVGDGPPKGEWLVGATVDTGEVHEGDVDGDLVVTVPIIDDGDVVGVVRAATPGGDAASRIATRWVEMFGLAVVALIATWALARYQSRRLAEPVEDLARAAERLGDGDFSVEERTVGIPEVDEVRAALNATAARLDSLIARERAFSAEASHQLRTPLTGLQLRLEAALRTPGSDHTAAIRASLAEVDRLERTISDLLALARGTRQRGVLDLPALLTEVSQVWGPRLGDQQRELRFAVEPGLPPTEASTAAIRQVFTVLLGNAVEHGAGAVTVGVRDIGEAVAIDVSDEGSLPAGPDLFERREPDAEGHGIGLALARRLVEAEGGRLQLTGSDPTTLTVFLPAGARAGDPAEPAATSEASPRGAPLSRP
ncbi:sensor histidine kinase [Pseudonocardia dioxanivorans]|uniref:sensor histidine kinase n=1 Tax=Pseudonocardia dioxanivorans TaxID=240495 RepID=UPI000CD23578|nr:HAMP domain-containing sensor histidine kinase [Pseudonocardia dioxanivorans]